MNTCGVALIRFMSTSKLESDVIRKNKVTDNLVKMELYMDQGSTNAFAQIPYKRFIF